MFACIHGPDAGILDPSRRNGSSRQFSLTEWERLDLRRVADSFSPFVEMVDEKTAVFSVTARQIGRLKELKEIQAAVASTAEAAILAARNLPGYTFIPPGDEARVLGALLIDALPPDPEIFETFDLWGIRSLADLSRLPDDALAARLGARGLRLQRLARGAIERPLRPQLPATVYAESIELDYALKLREPLLFLIARFLNDLTARLKSQSLAASSMLLTLNGNQRTLSVPFPTRDVKLLLKLIEHSLERQPPEAPVTKLRLELIPTEPRRVQHGLFTPAAPEPEKLELTLGKIRGLVGENNVGYPELFDTYRPGAARPTMPLLAFRYFRPPLETRIAADRLWTRMFQGKIVRIAGPWRSNGEWWRQDSWNRDEYDLELNDGALYRIFLDRSADKWFVEGVYD